MLISAFKRLSDSKTWQGAISGRTTLLPNIWLRRSSTLPRGDTQQTRQILTEMGLIK